MTSDERPPKRDAFLAFLAEGWVSLHLDARRPGVSVPDSFAREPHLVLQYGRDMPIPITDLEVTDDSVTATLSFARTPHRTVIPWAAVYVVACTDGRGILYHEDVPPEVALVANPAAESTTRAERPATRHETDPVEPPPRRLQSVPAEADPDEGDAASDDDTRRRRRRPTLRLVK